MNTMLTAEERKVFILSTDNDLDFRRVGQILAWTPSRVEEAFDRARIKLLVRKYGPIAHWVPGSHIVKDTGLPSKWVYARLKGFDHFSVTRKFLPYGKVLRLYPSALGDTLRLLRAESPVAPFDWKSRYQLHIELGAGYKWLNKRLEAFVDQGQMMKGHRAYSRLSLHFPPEIVSYIEIQWMEYSALPLKSSSVTIPEIARAVGRSRDWVSGKLSDLDPDPRIDSSGRVVPTYDRALIDVLIMASEEETIKPTEIPGQKLQREFGLNRFQLNRRLKKVKKRLAFDPDTGQMLTVYNENKARKVLSEA